MIRFSHRCALLLVLCSLGCVARPTADVKGGGAMGAGAPKTEQSSAAGAQSAPGDPAASQIIDVQSSAVVSAHNSLGDRINLEKFDPWPPIVGPNAISISFKAAEGAALEMGDHMGVEVALEDAPADALSVQSGYSGGMSGGTFTWQPTQAGAYIIRTYVSRKGKRDGELQFRVMIPGETAVAPAEPTDAH